MTDLQKTMGAVIRQERRARHRTLRELAKSAAVSVVYLGEVERGQKYPSARVLEQLAEAMEMPVFDLLGLVAVALRQEQEPISAPRSIGFAPPAKAAHGQRMSLEPTILTLRPFEVAVLGAYSGFQGSRLRARHA